MNCYVKILFSAVLVCGNQVGFAQNSKGPAGEITSLEWNILGSLVVSYAVGKTGNSIQVNCTAFNENKKPVGGGFSFTAGGVARVSIEVPSKYVNTNNVTVSCVP